MTVFLLYSLVIVVYDRSIEDSLYMNKKSILWNNNQQDGRARLLKDFAYGSLTSEQPSDRMFDLVFTTTIGGKKNTLSKDNENTLLMFALFQKQYKFKAVVFSSTPVVISFCQNHSIPVVTSIR